MKWRNSKERELLASGMGSRDQTLPNKNNPNPDLSDAVCDRNQSVSPGSTSSAHSEAKVTTSVGATGDGGMDSRNGGGPPDEVAAATATDKDVRNDGMYVGYGTSAGTTTAQAAAAVGAGAEASPMQTSFLANIYNGKLSYPSIKSHTYKASDDYDDTSDSSLNSDEEINVT